MGTLTNGVISTTYKNIIFTDKTSSGVGDIYYTDGSDNDVRLTTFTSALTLTAIPTFTAGIKLGSAGIIQDSGGNEAIKIVTTGSAVNYLEITPSAGENAVLLDVKGDGTNPGLTLDAKGSGVVTVTPRLKVTAGIELDNNIIYASDGATAITTTASSGNVLVAGTLTSTGDLIVNGGDATITAANDNSASILMQADNSDDAGDDWKIIANSGQTFTIGNDIASAGSFVNLFTITPHAIASSSTVTIAGDLAISGGNITTALTCDSTLGVTGVTTLSNNLTFSGARDIIWTDGDGLEMKDVGGSTYFAFTADAIAASQPLTCSGMTKLNGNTGPSAGTGADGTAVYKTWVEHLGGTSGMIKTSIYIDITGLRANGDEKVIGEDGGTANCHFGQITTALNGVIKAGRMTCLEAPAGHSSILDIDLVFDDAADGEEATDLTGETALVTRGGDWAINDTRAFTNDTITADNYLYLITGTNATDTAYTAGKFLIEIWGTTS